MRKLCSGLAQTGASGTTDVDEAVRQARIVGWTRLDEGGSVVNCLPSCKLLAFIFRP